jgi:hypothetical protein
MHRNVAAGTLLRVRMSRWDEMPELDAAVPPWADTEERRAVESRRERAESDRNVVFEVMHRGTHYGPFAEPVAQMGIPRNGRELQRLSKRTARDPIDGVVERARAWAAESLDRAWMQRVVGPIRRRLDPVFIPWRVLSVLARCTADLDEGEPLWLEIGDPPGYLPLVPWERLLHYKLKVPVLRIGQHRVRAVTYEGCVDLVVCASAVVRRDVLPTRLVVRHLRALATSAHPCRVHVFADDQYFAPLAKAFPLRVAKDEGEIAVYPPPSGEAPARNLATAFTSLFRPGSRRVPEAKEHPWLHWIRAQMDGWAADIVHCICSGAVFEEYGTVVSSTVPRADTDRAKKYRLAHFVSPLEMDEFCNQLGAWALVVSATGGRTSRYGLRMHMDEVSRLRPGFVALHDAADDSTGRILGDLYRYIARDAPPVGSSALSVTANEVNPTLVAPTEPGVEDQEDLSEEIRRFQDALSKAAEGGSTPSLGHWAAMSQRLVERTTSSDLSSGPRSDVEMATDRGVVEALSFVSNLLSEHRGKES